MTTRLTCAGGAGLRHRRESAGEGGQQWSKGPRNRTPP